MRETVGKESLIMVDANQVSEVRFYVRQIKAISIFFWASEMGSARGHKLDAGAGRVRLALDRGAGAASTGFLKKKDYFFVPSCFCILQTSPDDVWGHKTISEALEKHGETSLPKIITNKTPLPQNCRKK